MNIFARCAKQKQPAGSLATVLLLVIAFFELQIPAVAEALVACTASDVIAQSGTTCPSGLTPCTITKDFDIGNNCVLDFGQRDVTIAYGSVLDIGSGTATFKARNLTVGAGGYIDARGNAAAPNNTGGHVFIECTQSASVLKQTSVGRIDAGGNASAGSITITTGEAFSLAGRLNVDGLSSQASGGSIAITATGNITTLAGSTFTAQGGTGRAGGVITVTAGGTADLGETVLLDGGDGGRLTVAAGGQVLLGGISAKGVGNGLTTTPGSGGTIVVDGMTGVQFRGRVLANGTSDGSGGQLKAYAQLGSISIQEDVQAKTTLPYEGGEGGQVSLTALGAVTIDVGHTVSTRADGRYSYGGTIELEGGGGVAVSGVLDATGGADGGDIVIHSPADVTLYGALDAAGTGYGGAGGSIVIEAGLDGAGHLSISGSVDVGGGPCNSADGCGLGGTGEFAGCNITILSSGDLDARAPEGQGKFVFTPHEQLVTNGSIDALRTGTTGIQGRIDVRHRSAKLPSVGGSIQPAPTLLPLQTCTASSEPVGCLSSCGACGDSVVQFPENCDDGGTANCDGGCNRFCRLEDCNDQNVCTTDSCNVTYGCIHTVVQSCSP